MATRGAKPPEENRGTNWLHTDCEPGKSWTGWIAGDAVGVDTHYCFRTIPCLKRYYGKHAPCEGCTANKPVDFSYYQPLYRHFDSRPVVVILHKDQQDILNRVKFHELVTIGRTSEDFTGLYMARLMKPEPFETTLTWKKVPQDIAAYLPTLWRLRGVIDGETLLRGPLVPEPLTLLGDEMPRKPLSSDDTVKVSAAVVSQNFVVAGEDGPRPLAGDMADVYERLKSRGKPSKNGKH